jgi:hypothetical protein
MLDSLRLVGECLMETRLTPGTAFLGRLGYQAAQSAHQSTWPLTGHCSAEILSLFSWISEARLRGFMVGLVVQDEVSGVYSAHFIFMPCGGGRPRLRSAFKARSTATNWKFCKAVVNGVYESATAEQCGVTGAETRLTHRKRVVGGTPWRTKGLQSVELRQ